MTRQPARSTNHVPGVDLATAVVQLIEALKEALRQPASCTPGVRQIETEPTLPPGAPVLLTVTEAGKLLDIPRNRMYQMIAAGTIPSLRLSQRVIRIPRSGLEDWIRAGRLTA